MPEPINLNEHFFEADMVEYFEYLDALRESGVTNMIGGGRYLEKQFDLSQKEAGPVLLAWMDTFSTEAAPAERAKAALAKAA